MKVLIHNRNPKIWKGGDAVQVNETLKSLQSFGVQAEFSSDTLINPIKFDLVHVFHINFFWTTPLMLECIKHNVPYVVSAIYFDREIDNDFDLMGKLLNGAKTVIALSNREKQELVSRFNLNNVVVIPNGINKAVFKTAKKPQKRDFLLYVGRLNDKAKGAEFAIKAAQELNKTIFTVGASNNSDFSKWCKKNSRHFEYLSPIKLSELYQSCAVYTCTSLSERQSLSVLEAAACGASVVDTVFNRGNDLLPSSVVVDPRQQDQLIKAIKYQWGRTNTDRVPTWDEVALQIKAIYES